MKYIAKTKLLIIFLIVLMCTEIKVEAKNTYAKGDIVGFGHLPYGSTTQYVSEDVQVQLLNKTKGYYQVGGSYYYSNGKNVFATFPVRWIVLEDTGDSMLLISQYVISSSSFSQHMNGSEVKWGNSDIRNKLNSQDFMDFYFTKSEQNDLLTNEISTLTEITKDKIYILSYDEIVTYFPSNELRIAHYYSDRIPDVTVPITGFSDDIAYDRVNLTSAYWTRTYGKMNYGFSQPVYIGCDGAGRAGGRVYNTWSSGIRPVIRINKNSKNYFKAASSIPNAFQSEIIALEEGNQTIKLNDSLKKQNYITILRWQCFGQKEEYDKKFVVTSKIPICIGENKISAEITGADSKTVIQTMKVIGIPKQPQITYVEDDTTNKGDKIVLSWEGTTTNGKKCYEVSRSTSPDGPFEVIFHDEMEPDNSNIYYFTDEKVKNGKTYWYRVRGLFAVYNKETTTTTIVDEMDGFSGEYSNVLKVTAKEKRPAPPSGLKAVKPSSQGASDGRITGVSTSMEYSIYADFKRKTKCNGTEIKGLKAGTYYVRIAETSSAPAGDSATIVIEDGPILLTGNLQISGNLKYGQTIKAVLSNSNNTGTLSYKWKRGSSVIKGATKQSYKLVKEDIGQTITCVVTSSNESSSISGKTASAIEKADGPGAPTGLSSVAATQKGKADGKIKGVNTTMEYATKTNFSNAKACTGTTITKLKAATYYVRIAETETTKAGSYKKVVVKDGPEPTPVVKVTDIFDDVKSSDWFVDAVQYVYDKGIMSGQAANLFKPNNALTRAEAITVLFNFEGKPKTEYYARLSDVPKGQWYSEPITWGYNSNIVSGYPDGSYGINDKVTREQFALMLYKYASMKGKSIATKSNVLAGFTDKNKVDTWAKEAMEWAVSQGIMSGKPVGNSYILDPEGNATRAECASMMMKFAALK